MDPDDRIVGRLLTRREVLTLLGAAGAWALTVGCGGKPAPRQAGAATDSAATASLAAPPRLCVVRPEQTEGPYYVDTGLERTDLRADPTDGSVRAGVPLDLAIRVSALAAGGPCTPIAGAVVDLWGCDAGGIYSGVRDVQFDTTGRKFLRGFQRTDAAGIARFTTIYPGWYRGRTVHLHFMVRTDPDAARGATFVSQLYFDDALTDRVHAGAPYAAKGKRDRRNRQDGIYRRGGEQLLVHVEERGGRLAGTFDLALEDA